MLERVSPYTAPESSPYDIEFLTGFDDENVGTNSLKEYIDTVSQNVESKRGTLQLKSILFSDSSFGMPKYFQATNEKKFLRFVSAIRRAQILRPQRTGNSRSIIFSETDTRCLAALWHTATISTTERDLLVNQIDDRQLSEELMTIRDHTITLLSSVYPELAEHLSTQTHLPSTFNPLKI